MIGKEVPVVNKVSGFLFEVTGKGGWKLSGPTFLSNFLDPIIDVSFMLFPLLSVPFLLCPFLSFPSIAFHWCHVMSFHFLSSPFTRIPFLSFQLKHSAIQKQQGVFRTKLLTQKALKSSLKLMGKAGTSTGAKLGEGERGSKQSLDWSDVFETKRNYVKWKALKLKWNGSLKWVWN